jgi:hypothetical protein
VEIPFLDVFVERGGLISSYYYLSGRARGYPPRMISGSLTTVFLLNLVGREDIREPHFLTRLCCSLCCHLALKLFRSVVRIDSAQRQSFTELFHGFGGQSSRCAEPGGWVVRPPYQAVQRVFAGQVAEISVLREYVVNAN